MAKIVYWQMLAPRDLHPNKSPTPGKIRMEKPQSVVGGKFSVQIPQVARMDCCGKNWYPHNRRLIFRTAGTKTSQYERRWPSVILENPWRVIFVDDCMQMWITPRSFIHSLNIRMTSHPCNKYEQITLSYLLSVRYSLLQ